MRPPFAKRVALAALLSLAAVACTSEPGVERRLARANEALSNHAGDAFRRGEALGDYRYVYAHTAAGSPEHRDAGFGLGMIGFIDILHTASRLANEATDATDDEGSSAALPEAEDLLPIVSTLIDVLLDQGIVEPWREIVLLDDYSFQFAEGAFVIPAFASDGTDVDLSGEWDLTEIRIVYGLVQSVIASYRYIELYDKVLETVVDAALTDATIPDFPDSPAVVPAWILDVSDALGFAQPPWLDPEFGILSDAAALTDVRARLSDGLNRIVDAFVYLQAEDDDQDDDTLPKTKFLKQLLVRLAGVEENDIVVTAVDPLIPLENIIELASLLRDSLDEDATVVLPPDWVWELVEAGLSVGVPDYAGPVDPIGLRVPAVNLSRLFTDPVVDLKDRDAGMLPYYCLAAEVGELPCARQGEFATVSEQEPSADADDDGSIDDGEFEDVGLDAEFTFVDADEDGEDDGDDLTVFAGDGIWQEPIALRLGDPALEDVEDAALLPPLAHLAPGNVVERPNGIVDPVYVFFGNADFNAFLVPMVETSEPGEFALDLTGTYANPDLMRLLSALIWIVDSVDNDE